MKFNAAALAVVNALSPGRITPPIVMASAAGWYVGSVWLNNEEPEISFVEPYDRMTDYMTQQDAEAVLAQWEAEEAAHRDDDDYL